MSQDDTLPSRGASNLYEIALHLGASHVVLRHPCGRTVALTVEAQDTIPPVIRLDARPPSHVDRRGGMLHASWGLPNPELQADLGEGVDGGAGRGVWRSLGDLPDAS